MPRIETLTKAQEARLAEYRDRWLQIGLSTEPTNREEAIAGVQAAYRAAGLEPPALWVWLESPYRGAIAAAMLTQVRAQVWDQVGAQVWDQVRAQVWDQVRDQVWAQVWAQVWDQVRAQVGDQVRAQVGDQVRAQVGDQVGDQVGAQVGDQVYRCAYGLHDAAWLGFYEFFEQVCGLECARRLRGLAQTARSTGWWWPFERLAVLTDRPKILRRDDRGRLHCEDGPAIQYHDGWGVWAWHGVRVAQDVIERPESLSVQQIDGEQNAEIRRVLMERYGHDKFLCDTNTQPIQQDDYGTLYRREVPGDEDLVMVRVINSTPEPDGSKKPYWLRVPPHMQTARAAVAWTFGFDAPSAYHPKVQT